MGFNSGFKGLIPSPLVMTKVSVWSIAPHFLLSLCRLSCLSHHKLLLIHWIFPFFTMLAVNILFFLSHLYKLDSIPQTNFRINFWNYESTFGRIRLKKVHFMWSFWCQRTERDKFWTHHSCFLGVEYSMFLMPCHYSYLFRTDYNEVLGVKAVLHCRFLQNITLFSVTYYISEDSAWIMLVYLF